MHFHNYYNKTSTSTFAKAPNKEANSAFAKATAACTRCSCVHIGIALMSTTFAASLAAGAANELLLSPNSNKKWLRRLLI